jgi:hypothetical protein
LTCGICGCWSSRMGKPFLTKADLSRHQSVAHGKSSLSSQGAPTDRSDPSPRARKPIRPQPPVDSMVKFCPQCGCSLDVITAALSLFR